MAASVEFITQQAIFLICGILMKARRQLKYTAAPKRSPKK
jgi:hypothetical protein